MKSQAYDKKVKKEGWLTLAVSLGFRHKQIPIFPQCPSDILLNNNNFGSLKGTSGRKQS